MAKFILALIPGADGRALKRDHRLIVVGAVEWISRRIDDAPADELIETRTISGDLHYVRAGDLRAAFTSLRCKHRATPEAGR